MIYELCYLVAEAKKPDIEKIALTVHDVLEKSGGTLSGTPVMEERKLSYPVKHTTRGIYITQRFTLPVADTDQERDASTADPIAELTRQYNLLHDLLRFIIVRADELPPLQTKEERIAQDQKRSQETLHRSMRSKDAIDTELEKVLKI